jgi:tetratricopeptide (TPR) repeat protein
LQFHLYQYSRDDAAGEARRDHPNHMQENSVCSTYRRALALFEKTVGPEHPGFAATLANLGLLLVTAGGYAEAETVCRRALAIREKVFGLDHPDVGQSLNLLATVLYHRRMYREAEPLFQQSLAIHERALGQDHPEVALTLNNLARLHMREGNSDTAAEEIRLT